MECEGTLVTKSQPASANSSFRRLVTFAAQHPDLAKLVHRLQLQVPPYITDTVRDGLRTLDRLPEFNSEQKSTIKDVLVPPLASWRSSQAFALSVYPQASWEIRDTFQSLPNLYHVEHLLSIQDRLTIGTLESNILEMTGAYINRGQILTIWPEESYDKAFNLIIPHSYPTIKSLKLRNISLSTGSWRRDHYLPARLQHLDLELCEYHYSLERRCEQLARPWRHNLAGLQLLTTLRLRWTEVCHDPIYIDDLLIDPKDSTKVIFFPRLKCFSVSGCSMRLDRLLTFATLHAPTLQEFELSRVTFDPSYCPESWSEISALCKSVLPNLTYLRLSKLVTHFPRRFYAPPGSAPISGSGDPVQEHWNPGLEATTAYEWRKGINGPDQEVKGPRCPWEAKDVIVTEECKKRFNSDRLWYSIHLDSGEPGRRMF